jgi:hypothetical protein
MTKEEAMAGLEAGRVLRCDRRDEPLLPWLLELSAKGIITNELVEVDEQYSYLEFKIAE